MQKKKNKQFFEMKMFVFLFISKVFLRYHQENDISGASEFWSKDVEQKCFIFYHLINVRAEPTRPGQLDPALPMRSWTAYFSEGWKRY